MPSVQKLRRHGTWEVLLLRDAIRIEDEGACDVLLVVEAKSGMVRLAGPLLHADELTDALARAAVEPMAGGGAAKPRSIACGSDLAAALAEAGRLLSAPVVVRPRLPAAERAAESLMTHLAKGGEALPCSDAPWPQLMQRALDAAPWSVVPDSVLFGLESADQSIEGAVVVVLGRAGTQLGFTIFPSLDAWRLFTAAVELDPAVIAALPLAFRCVHFSELTDEPPDLVRSLADAGLVRDGLFLDLYRAAPDFQGLEPLDEEAELAAFRAVEAVLGAWDRHGADLVLGPTSTRVTTRSGVVVTVHSLPAGGWALPPEPDLLDGPAQVRGVFPEGVFGDARPTLLFKYAKADAKRLQRALDGIDRLDLFEEPDHVRLEGWCRDEWLGVLTHLDEPPFPSDTEQARLLVASGGARRRSLHLADIQLDASVRVTRGTGAGGADDLGPLFRPRS